MAICNLISLLTPSGIVLNFFSSFYFIVQKLMMLSCCLSHQRLNSTCILKFCEPASFYVTSHLSHVRLVYFPTCATHLSMGPGGLTSFSLLHSYKDSFKAFHRGGYVLGISILFVLHSEMFLSFLSLRGSTRFTAGS